MPDRRAASMTAWRVSSSTRFKFHGMPDFMALDPWPRRRAPGDVAGGPTGNRRPLTAITREFGQHGKQAVNLRAGREIFGNKA
jgi:hypothetical protein